MGLSSQEAQEPLLGSCCLEGSSSCLAPDTGSRASQRQLRTRQTEVRDSGVAAVAHSGPCGWKVAGPGVMGNGPGEHQANKEQDTGLKTQKSLRWERDSVMSTVGLWGWLCTLTGIFAALLGVRVSGRQFPKHGSAFVNKLWFSPHHTAPLYRKGNQSAHILSHPPPQPGFAVYCPDEEVRVRSQSRNLFALNMSAPRNTVFSQPLGREKNRYKFCQKKTKYLP